LSIIIVKYLKGLIWPQYPGTNEAPGQPCRAGAKTPGQSIRIAPAGVWPTTLGFTPAAAGLQDSHDTVTPSHLPTHPAERG
jgi:hypothetical protein